MRWSFACLLMAVGIIVCSCGRESTYEDPPAGSWKEGASSKQAFFGPTTTQFNIKKDVISPSSDSSSVDLGSEEVGGPNL